MKLAPRILASIAGVGLALLALSMGFGNQFFSSYLYAYVFWTGLSLGSLALLMVHNLTGGEWGIAVRPSLEAAIVPLPLLGLLFVPLIFGLHELYPWTRAEEVAHSELLQKKLWYLDLPLFLSRTAGYFIIWTALALWLTGWPARQETRRTTGNVQGLSAAALILLVLTSSFAAVDWIMTLTPAWYSTLFGILVGLGQALGAMAFIVMSTLLLSHREPWIEQAPPGRLHDLGNLLLMFALVWVYLAFMEFITVWIADVPEEISWYLPRMQTSWGYFGWFLFTCQFALPFAVLLWRRAKRSRGMLTGVTALMLAGYWANTFWLVMPTFREAGFALHWSDLGAFIGIGGLWLSVFLWRLGTRLRTAAMADPREAVAHG